MVDATTKAVVFRNGAIVDDERRRRRGPDDGEGAGVFVARLASGTHRT
jgi:hypothetical protein